MHLIQLVKRHDKIAKRISQLNLLMRRTVAIYFTVITLVQILALNLYFDSKSFFYKTIYLIFLSASITLGFGIVFVSSLQINAAHKPAKLITKILYQNKRKLNFHFKWKVICLF